MPECRSIPGDISFAVGKALVPRGRRRRDEKGLAFDVKA